nr:MAG TPA: anaerobic ribonucleoside triphosphate reductase [Bacteriophage sp.]
MCNVANCIKHKWGCRSFLTPDEFTERMGNISNAGDYNGKHKYYGRFNCGVCTVNLADVALSAREESNKKGTDILDTFWEILNERTELCHRALQVRIKRLSNTESDVAPILWQHGALARLKKGEKLEKLVHNNYSTASLGYAALYECVMALIGKSHTTEEGQALGLEVLQFLNDKCTEWKQAENVGYSVYGSPIESTTYKFAKCLRERFGVIKDITDHDYLTNSYHISVREKIDAFTKFNIESKFQKLSPGGYNKIDIIPFTAALNHVKTVEVINYAVLS